MNAILLTILSATVSQDVRQQLRWAEHVATPAQARANGHQFPEGELFTWEFLGFSYVNIAETTRAPADIDAALRRGPELLAHIDEALNHRPFRASRDLPVRGGIIFLGGRNLLLARLVQLAPERATPAMVAQLHADTEIIRRAFVGDPTGIPESFRGHRWPVDALFALQSLRVHDEIYGTHVADEPLAGWLKAVRAAADRKTGLMPSAVTPRGRAVDVPRGCALSWSLAVLPSLDPKFAAEQWAAYKRHFLEQWLGYPAFREYPRGVHRTADADSGPMIGELGMSATAFALAAARANGDRALATRLEALGERLGGATSDERGRRYLFGSVPFFDVMALWTKTIPWPTT